MKKEYHYTISRTDRIYLVAFVMALLMWELVKEFFPGQQESYTYVAKEKNENDYKRSYSSKNDHRKKYPSKKYQYDNYKKDYSLKEKPILPPPAQPIALEEATVDELISMGFSKKVAYNIQKYLASGAAIYDEKC